MKNVLVSDIMTRDPISVKPDTNLLECAKKMVKNKVGSLLLVEKKRLKGIIAEKDILWAMVKKSEKGLSKIKAIDISPRKIATIKPDASIDDAVNKIKSLKFYRLPVIKEGELVGMITWKDILSFYPQLQKEFSELEQIREERNKLRRLKKAKVRETVMEGICEECGNHDILFKVDGLLICESCMNSI